MIRTVKLSKDAAVATSLYGTTERYKCVTDRGTSVHLNCVAHILHTLHIQHPVGHLVNDLVQNHHDTYGCGTKTLLMMLDLLAVTALTLKHKGLDEVTIARGLMQAVELSIACLPTLPLSSVFETENCPDENNTQEVASTSHGGANITANQGVNDEIWTEVSLDIPQTEPTDQAIANIIKKSLQSSEGLVDTDKSASVHLKMRPKQDALMDDLDDDDVGWFFDDGRVPNDDKMDESIQELLSRAADLLVAADDFDEDQDQGFTAENKVATLETKCTLEKLIPSDVSIKPTDPSFSSLQDDADEDDFDSCFDTTPPPQPYSASSHNTLSKEKSYIHPKVESDDEFDSCFDGVSYKATDKHTKSYKLQNLPGCEGLLDQIMPSHQFREGLNGEKDMDKIVDAGLDAQKIERENIENQFEKAILQYGKDDTSVERQHLDLNEKLNEIMKKKKKSTCLNASIQNQSRHFKTIETTIHEMENDTPDISEQSLNINDVKPSTDETMNVKIEAILKSKKSLAKGVVLNRSRHYRDIKSSVLEMSSEGNQQTSADLEIVFQNRSVPVDIPNISENYVKKSSDKEKHEVADTLATNEKLNGILTLNAAIPVACKASRQQSTAEDSSDEPSTGIQSTASTQSSFLISNHTPTQNQDSTCITQIKTPGMASQPAQIIEAVQSAVTQPAGSSGLVTEVKLKSFVLGLSRGEEQIAQMVSTAAWQQQGQEGRSRGAVLLSDFRFEVNCLHTVTLVGVSSMRSDIVNGLVMSASPDDLALLQHPTHRRALLINGDVSPNFQHRGMNNKPETVLVRKHLATMSREERWLKNITRVLEKFSISALLVKGKVSAEVIDHCNSRGTVVLSHVATKELLAIAETTQSSIASYVAECTEDNVAKDVMIRPWSPDWSDQVTSLRHTAYTVLTTSADVIQTAVMCHPCADVAAVMEEKFLHIACRLRNAISSNQVIEGGFEELVAERLDHAAQKMRLESSDGPDRDDSCMLPVIVEAVSDSFHSLSLTLQANSVIGDFPVALKSSAIRPDSKVMSTDEKTILSIDHGADVSICSMDYRIPIDSSLPEIQESTSEQYGGRNDADAYNVEDHVSPAVSGYMMCVYPEEFSYKVVDDYTSRVEAIKCAAHLVCQVLQMDYEVVTGLTGTEVPVGDDVIGML